MAKRRTSKTIKRPRKQSVSEEAKAQRAMAFIEELSWLLQANKSLTLKETPEILRKQLEIGATKRSNAANPENRSNVNYLIGVLPGLFQDTTLFSRNEDIASFAYEVLGIDITRVEKRSRYELIGRIVTEANELNDAELDQLVSSLKQIAGDSRKLSVMAKEKDGSSFSWNETIRKLTVD